jgi:O-acetylhomoserine (thiol)-lyase
MPYDSKHAETLVLHGGQRSDPETKAVATPIYQTTAFEMPDFESAADLFALKSFGNIYSRIMNPTNAELEQRLTAIEGGVPFRIAGITAAMATASGQAATLMSIQNIAHAGDNIVSSTDLYGGTWNLFANTLSTMGIETRFVDPEDPQAFADASDEKTRCYYAETLPNPKLQVFPIAEVAEVGRELGIPLIMDNTAAPLLCRPFDHGAAVVMHSTTKYIGGHGNGIGGIVIDGGNFPWEAHAERFPMLTEPDPSYHGAVWTEAVRDIAPIAYIVKLRVHLMRDFGACMSPTNAFNFIQGLETLPLRMERHCQNAAQVAEYLSEHPKVTKVIYPGMMEGIYRARADTYLQGGYGNLVGFELEGGRDAGGRFINGLELFYFLANIGDARSLAIHPASSTHSQLEDDELEQTGVTQGYVRLSVGIEHIDDIIADLDRALAAA